MNKNSHKKRVIKTGVMLFIGSIVLLYGCLILTSFFYHTFIKDFKNRDTIEEVIELSDVNALEINCLNECSYSEGLSIFFADVQNARLSVSNATKNPFKIRKEQRVLYLDFISEINDYRFSGNHNTLTVPLSLKHITLKDMRTNLTSNGSEVVDSLDVKIHGDNSLSLIGFKARAVSISQQTSNQKSLFTLKIGDYGYLNNQNQSTKIEALNAKIEIGEVDIMEDASIERAELFVTPKVKLIFGGYAQWKTTRVNLID